MATPVPADMVGPLDVLRRDFTETTGCPFKRFFCPLLLADDEDAELCMGHVVTDATGWSSQIRVPQRKDVDNFFGRVFEPDLALLTEVSSNPKGAVFDEALHRKMKPRFMAAGEECPHYLYQNTILPPEHTGIVLENPSGDEVKLVLKMPPSQVSAATKRWQIIVERDFRVGALVALIRSAFLTLFRLRGYGYALSAGGLEIGRLLGKFFREHRDKSREEILREAKEWFRPYVSLVRPIDGFSGDAPRGTIEDHGCMLCFRDGSVKPFGVAVCIRANDQYHAVVMPMFDTEGTAAAYVDFLNSKNETIDMAWAQYDPEKRCWYREPNIIKTSWPKKGDCSILDN